MSNLENNTKPGILSWIICILLAELIAFVSIFFECVLLRKFELPFPSLFVNWFLTFLLGPGTLYWIIYHKLKKTNKLTAFIIIVANLIFFSLMYVGITLNLLAAVYLYDFFARNMLGLYG